MNIPRWKMRMRYRFLLNKLKKHQNDLSKDDAYRILECQFFFTSEQKIDTVLIDRCLNCLFPDRHEWAYSEKERRWSQLLERIEHEEAMQKRVQGRPVPHPRYKRVPSSAIAFVLLFAILLIGSTVAYALGFDVIQYVVHWTEELLNITVTTDSSETTDVEQVFEIESNRGVALDLKETLQDLGIQPHLPQWIPDGFQLIDISRYSLEPNIQAFDAYYSDGSDGEFFVTVYAIDPATTYNLNTERNNDEFSYVHQTQTGEYYFVRNMERYTVSWIESNCWIMIAGTLDEDVLLQMIDSLYE